MNPYQRMAWFNLTVILFTCVAFAGLYTATGNLGGSQAAFACLALIGFSGLFLAGVKGRAPLDDEYHRWVRQKSSVAAMTVFWLYFVAGSVYMTVHFETSIPKDLYSLFFWFGFILVLTVQSLATLFIYSSDLSERRTLLNRFRSMNNTRKSGLIPLLVFCFVGFPFLWVMNKGRYGELPPGFMLLTDISFAVMYALDIYLMVRTARTDSERQAVRRARRWSLAAMGTAAAAALAVAGRLTVIPAGNTPWDWYVLFYIFNSLFVGLLVMPLSLVILGGLAKETRKTNPSPPDPHTEA
ncbi:hypothetical protein LLH00_02110 [bacterium]|nr:hypothetical protein [bacterium]